jgi:hypothetical protein
MRRISSCTFIAAALLAVNARYSAAQAPLEGGPATTTTTTTTTTGTTTSGTGAGHGGTLGVGIMAPLIIGFPGVSAVFDGAAWHLEGLLGLQKGNSGPPNAGRVSVDVGGRFWFHIHATSNSDFSVGGGLTYLHLGPQDTDSLLIDAGGQMRAFITTNVALSVTMGLGLATIDYNNLILGGNLFGAAGIHYYFF